jgi:hypothetical protein
MLQTKVPLTFTSPAKPPLTMKLTALLSLSSLLFSSPGALAQLTTTWTGLGDGSSFTDAANWDTGVPGSLDTAQLTGGSAPPPTTVIEVVGGQSISALEVNASPARWRIEATGPGNSLELGRVTNDGSERLRLRGNFNAAGLLELEANGERIIIRDGSVVNQTTTGDLLVSGSNLVGLAQGSTVSGFGRIEVTGELRLTASANASGVPVELNGGVLRGNGNTAARPAANIGGLTGTGQWVFALGDDTDRISPFAIVDGTVDFTNIDVRVSNGISNFPDASPSNPVVLAEFSSLPGALPTSSNLLPGQSLAFINPAPGRFQMVVVPEISLATPLLAGFLPLLALRRRKW